MCRGRYWLLLVLLVIGPTVAFSEPAAADQRVLLRVWEDLRLGRWTEVERRLPALTGAADADVACQARFAEGNL